MVSWTLRRTPLRHRRMKVPALLSSGQNVEEAGEEAVAVVVVGSQKLVRLA